MRYPMVVHKVPESDYGVPDFPGCFSTGEILDEALMQIVEAIECHLKGLLLVVKLIPVPDKPLDKTRWPGKRATSV